MSIFGNLEIGKTGLNAAQLGQKTTGHNIANVHTEGYSRQRAEQSADTSKHFGGLHGVRVDRIARVYNQFNTEKVIGEESKSSDWEAREAYMKMVEASFQDLDGKNLGEALGSFWNAWSSAASQPESQAERQNLLSSAEDLIAKIKGLDQRLSSIQGSLNKEMLGQMDEVNDLAKKIAELNKEIHRVESSGNPVGDLKDKRDLHLAELARKVDINWFFSKEGHIDINLPQGAAIVRGTTAYKVEPYINSDQPEFPLVGYEIAPSVLINLSPSMKAGSLKAIETVRDKVLGGLREELKTLAKTLVDKTNDIYSPGHGMVNPYHQIVSAYAISPESIDQPLSFVQDGILKFELKPNSDLQNPLELSIEVKAGEDSLASVIDKINLAAEKIQTNYKPNNLTDAENEKPKKPPLEEPPLIAELSPANHLQIKSGRGFSFRMLQDTSGLMSRLGFNSFLQMDKSLEDLKINPFIKEDEMRIALGNGKDPGSNEIALAIHDLQFEKVLLNDTVTLDEFYRSLYTRTGRETKKAIENNLSHKNILDQFKAMEKAVTGVNLDEEMANMMKYQKAYEASARYISTVDQMTDALIRM